MRARDIWIAWATMLAMAIFGAIMITPANAQWRGGMRGGWHGPVWHGGGYYRPGWRGGWGPAPVVGGLVGGLAAGVGLGIGQALTAPLVAPEVGYGPCWRWDGLVGWTRIC